MDVDEAQVAHSAARSTRVPVVGIGASAGGVTALQAFFKELPANTGAAYVVIVHLDPEYQSELGLILAACTSMPVVQVADTQSIELNKVYVIPPNRRLLITDEQISTEPFDEPRWQRAPIDFFFRSLADQHGDGFAIILTGAGSDGSVGVKFVKEAGGLVIVQDPNEAEHPSMPRNAIASGVADLVLPVREIALRMGELIRKKLKLQSENLVDGDKEALQRILGFLRLKTGHDFTNYKRATVVRRLARRLQVTRTDNLQDYSAYLRDNAEEVQALFGNLLISVTSFFRDRDVFKSLADKIIPKLFDEKSDGANIRVWVPGCATGEEAYSIAMLLLEEADRREIRPHIQLFASDLDAGALAAARQGSYPSTISADVSESRLNRFFLHDGDQYTIKREVRDLIVFAAHSLLRDPPFSHLDFISCRNLLIYLDRELQSQVAATFHYALRAKGYLLVGTAESIDASSHFRAIDRDTRTYQAIEQPRDKLPPLQRIITGPPVPEYAGRTQPRRPGTGVDISTHRQVLDHNAPPSMLVDAEHHILTLSEGAGRFLLHTGGLLSTEAPDIVRPELRLDLRAALRRAFDQNEPSLSVPVSVKFNGTSRHVSVQVRPVTRDGGSKAALVLFVEGRVIDRVEEVEAAGDSSSSLLIDQLREELRSTREHLDHSRDQYEAVTEQLSASNEELQSMNEEYRSTAEELETSKEELQSINEELQTLNSELKSKLESVARAHNDLENLMAGTDVATLFLDSKLRIKRITPRLGNIFNVVQGDEGRPISDLTHRLEYDALARDAKVVLANLQPSEKILKGEGNLSFLMRMRPYRTLDDRIEGVVVTFVDVTEQQNAEQRWNDRQKLMVRELTHRIKNTLSVVRALVQQTLRHSGETKDVQSTLMERLDALAKAHDLFLDTDRKSADFGDLARSQLAGLVIDSARIQFSGQAANVGPALATPLGLILHELATNAVKYGALSNDTGLVALQWEVTAALSSSQLRIVWTESGGPSVKPPQRKGFGAKLIELGLSNGTIERQFLPDGLICAIEVPISG